jgi:hypothetical protein
MVEVADYSHLGVRSTLRLEFLADKLMRVTLLPGDSAKYLEALTRERGITFDASGLWRGSAGLTVRRSALASGGCAVDWEDPVLVAKFQDKATE